MLAQTRSNAPDKPIVDPVARLDYHHPVGTVNLRFGVLGEADNPGVLVILVVNPVALLEHHPVDGNLLWASVFGPSLGALHLALASGWLSLRLETTLGAWGYQ